PRAERRQRHWLRSCGRAPRHSWPAPLWRPRFGIPPFSASRLVHAGGAGWRLIAAAGIYWQTVSESGAAATAIEKSPPAGEAVTSRLPSELVVIARFARPPPPVTCPVTWCGT